MAARKPKTRTQKIVVQSAEEKAARAGLVKSAVLGLAQNQSRIGTQSRGAYGGVNVRQGGTNLAGYDMGKYSDTTKNVKVPTGGGGAGSGGSGGGSRGSGGAKPGPTKAQKAAAAAAIARVRAAVARAKLAKATAARIAKQKAAAAAAAKAKAAAAKAAHRGPKKKPVQVHVKGKGPLAGGV